jgi:hypothetical protein
MKLTLRQIANATNAIGGNGDGPLQRLLQKELPAATAFKMARIARIIDVEVKSMQEQHRALVKKHGTEYEGGNIRVEADEILSFANDLDDLLAVEIDLEIDVLSIDLLDKVRVMPADMLALSFIFDDKENSNE